MKLNTSDVSLYLTKWGLYATKNRPNRADCYLYNDTEFLHGWVRKSFVNYKSKGREYGLSSNAFLRS